MKPTAGQSSRTRSRTAEHRRLAAQADSRRKRRLLLIAAGTAVVLIGGLFAIFRLTSSGQGASGGSDASYPFQVGQPGPGKAAPPIQLASTAGGTFDLSAYRGKTVLLFFQEGLTCQPCWDQLKAIDDNLASVTQLGINQVVSITSDPVGQIQQKVSDAGITSPVLSDPNLAVSSAYHTNDFGMMGTSRDGHSFIVVGPTGTIRWRADYGGAPNYTMNVPINVLLDQMRQGLAGS
jgi:peroxiredoxin Q/BCP